MIVKVVVVILLVSLSYSAIVQEKIRLNDFGVQNNGFMQMLQTSGDECADEDDCIEDVSISIVCFDGECTVSDKSLDTNFVLELELNSVEDQAESETEIVGPSAEEDDGEEEDEVGPSAEEGAEEEVGSPAEEDDEEEEAEVEVGSPAEEDDEEEVGLPAEENDEEKVEEDAEEETSLPAEEDDKCDECDETSLLIECEDIDCEITDENEIEVTNVCNEGEDCVFEFTVVVACYENDCVV
ncbi:hypothetical protein SteCoe_22377 [Stentor coeruleus]|uniref:Uncharacterized protein n=1 Tax=Stentor coeruleus TaxID=5963 RepID=A0A1R2BMI4_9CILI|nr:hypothetical protein SteCoe_22377 [Stentor coeruleus]